jgi:D-inositol-3-phosphate glycosyltransferase
MLSYHTCPLAVLGGKDTGGMNVYVRELTRQLGVQGVHVDVFTRSQDEHVPHVLHDLGYGNRVVHIPAGPEIPLPKEELLAYVPEFTRGILEFCKSKGLEYDIIHAHYWMSGLAGLALQETWNTPVIQMFHTLGLMKQRIARSDAEREGEYRIQGEMEVIQKVNWIVASTLAEVAQLQWLYNANARKIVIIPPGVDPCRFYPIQEDEAKEFVGLRQQDRLILFVGRIEPLKGIDTLIEAMAILRNRGFFQKNPFYLAVIGGESTDERNQVSAEMARLQELREHFQLSDLVTFLGKKAQDTLPYYYSAAEVVVVPSFYESFGMVALESMACGTPVIASQVGGLAFLVQDGETGFTVPFDDPEALADKLSYLLDNQELRVKMGMRAAEFARQYAWDVIAHRVSELYATATRQPLSTSEYLKMEAN